ncbi:MarR family transcriptional regulator [Nocardioides sp. YIM 152315]|uniref:MarR family winged helix-turn-helix transcriptional regulator n=1 Tax=Nocardioides sp. YIM 152315 TaxID=3031760 RepID=UPI0023DBB2B8|nr:MarR family transcriptional regulator [Nocardioides sp. YIM 152315]MDF1601939.1 MarR family transcriptional regulator [Nocardioides sp. YIM 152315]
MTRSPRTREDLESDAADAVLTASRALLAVALRSVQSASVDVTVAQHRVLVILASQGPQSVGDLATHLGVDQSNASRHCTRLHRAALVDRRPSPDDGRAVEIAITRAGAAVVAEVTAARHAEITTVLSQMESADVDATVRGLTAFNAAAEELSDDAWLT